LLSIHRHFHFSSLSLSLLFSFLCWCIFISVSSSFSYSLIERFRHEACFISLQYIFTLLLLRKQPTERAFSIDRPSVLRNSSWPIIEVCIFFFFTQ
jgi:hypothetical protein